VYQLYSRTSKPDFLLSLEKVIFSYSIQVKMKSTSFLAASVTLAASAAAQTFDECFITPGVTSTEFAYAFSLSDLTTSLCAGCSTSFTAAAAAHGVTIESFACDETTILPAIGGDAVFSVLFNNTGPGVSGEFGPFAAFSAALEQCALPGGGFGCPEGNGS
jgi:hypothetical protein